MLVALLVFGFGVGGLSDCHGPTFCTKLDHGNRRMFQARQELSKKSLPIILVHGTWAQDFFVSRSRTLGAALAVWIQVVLSMSFR